jgi:hypothetical protein
MQTLMVLVVNEEKYEYRSAVRSGEDEMITSLSRPAYWSLTSICACHATRRRGMLDSRPFVKKEMQRAVQPEIER